MALLMDKSQRQKESALSEVRSFPVETFKEWWLAQLLRSYNHRNNEHVDFDSDPLLVVFSLEHANELIHSPGSEGNYIGFFFGSEIRTEAKPYVNLTCFMALTKKIEEDKFVIVSKGSVYEGGVDGSKISEDYIDKICNYKSRIVKLRDDTNHYKDEFNHKEKNGVHYPINTFNAFVEYIKGAGNHTKDKFKSIFVKRTDDETTALVHSVYDFSLKKIGNLKDDELFDAGNGCCPII